MSGLKANFIICGLFLTVFLCHGQVYKPGQSTVNEVSKETKFPDAEKVAKLVISKIKKGEMPPSVTVEEMKKLKVLN